MKDDLALLREKLALLEFQIDSLLSNYSSTIYNAFAGNLITLTNQRSEVLKAIAAHTLKHFHDFEGNPPARTLQDSI